LLEGYLIVEGFTLENWAAGIRFPSDVHSEIDLGRGYLIVEGFTLENWAAGIRFPSDVHSEIDLERGKA
jgi:hypothetical protein